MVLHSCEKQKTLNSWRVQGKEMRHETSSIALVANNKPFHVDG